MRMELSDKEVSLQICITNHEIEVGADTDAEQNVPESAAQWMAVGEHSEAFCNLRRVLDPVQWNLVVGGV